MWAPTTPMFYYMVPPPGSNRMFPPPPPPPPNAMLSPPVVMATEGAEEMETGDEGVPMLATDEVDGAERVVDTEETGREDGTEEDTSSQVRR